MGIVVTSAGCEGGSEVQGKSGVPRCHSTGWRGWAVQAAGEAPRTAAGLHLGYSCSSSGEGKARVGSVVPLQS